MGRRAAGSERGPACVQGGEHGAREHEEHEVLAQLPGEPAAPMTADRQSVDGHAVDALASGLAASAQAQHVDVDAPILERERLSLHPRLAHGVLRVHHHAVAVAAHDAGLREP